MIGNCGYAPAPINPATAPLMQAYTAFIKPRDLEWNWRTFGEYLDYLEQHGVFMNTVPLAAHGALRIAVMGFEARAPNDEELAQMQRHLHECMESGAYGVSCGLIYAPGMFASTDELAALAEGLPAYDGIFAFHIRGSSETLVQAAQEVVEVARRGGVRVQHSHLEAFGKGHWGKVEETLALHEQARGQGVDHGFDVIPYVAANTTFLAVLPPWSLDGGVEQLLERLRDPGTRSRIKHDVEHLIPDWPTWRPGSWPHNLVEATGWDNVWIMWVESERNKQFEGKSVARLAEETGKDPVRRRGRPDPRRAGACHRAVSRGQRRPRRGVGAPADPPAPERVHRDGRVLARPGQAPPGAARRLPARTRASTSGRRG